ncbi:MAG: OsmC family protein [Porticoccus sp.]|nr:OsmC family protein [Porticoccus sp.]MBQ0807883.1 OsmC family protein [Porticoccus sp.]
MKSFPHTYTATAAADPIGNVTSSLGNGCRVEIAPPVEFDGAGDVWSPEELLMSSVASCLVLSFKSIARSYDLSWLHIECFADGQLEKVERKVKFTRVHTRVKLTITSLEDSGEAKRILEKAEDTCFITNSLSAETGFSCEIVEG